MSKTIYDVADAAGVSISTVSRVINESGYVSENTRLKVQQAMEGYYPNSAAREIVTKKTMTIGLIVSKDPEYVFSNSVYSKVLMGISEIANQYNYKLLLDINKSEYDYSMLYKEKKVDGLILVSVKNNSKYITKLAEKKIPFVLLGDYIKNNIIFPTVETEDRKAVFEAVNHLINLGHKKIGFISGPMNYASGINRLEGYKDAINNANIGYNRNYIQGVKNPSIDMGYIMGKKLLEMEDRPTGIFTFNDTIGIGLYNAANELNITIPKKLSVIGFDDSEVAKYLLPPLTTVWQPSYEKGLKAAKLLISIIEKKDFVFKKNMKFLFPTKLIIRDSCTSPCVFRNIK